MQQLYSLSLAVLFTLLLSGQVLAQTPVPFWTEDFTNGFPAGWTTSDGAGQGVLWTWCPNPLQGDNDPGCSEPWDDPLNGQVPFKSSTATTGCMVCDSDDAGPKPVNHVSRLTTAPINCIGKSEVFITFQTHIGVFENNADANAILRVSTDGTTWTDHTVFPGLTTAIRWSENPEIPIIDISSTAANQPNVFIQWQWTGNWEYMWSIDDVEIYDQDPTPANDLGISAFFYPVSSFEQPSSQIAGDVFRFQIDVDNKGKNDQTNIVATAYVKEDGGTTLYTQTVQVPLIEAGAEDFTITFPNTFTPTLLPGLYLVGYTISADSLDQRPVDNQRESPFVVGNNRFAKEDGPEQGYRPSAGGDWAVGNLYQMGNNLEKYKATQAEFAFATNSNELDITDVEANVYLLKVNADVAPDFSNFDGSGFLSTSLDLLSIAEYQAPDTVQQYDLQRVALDDLNTGGSGVVLEAGARYLLAVEYQGLSAVTFHTFNDDVFYFFPSTFIYNNGNWNPAGFGGDVNAVARMYISLVSSTDEQKLPENTMTVLPNPVSESLQIALQFEKVTDATITIADLNGRVIRFDNREGLSNEILRYPVSALPSGSYLVRIATANGTLTKKFVKI